MSAYLAELDDENRADAAGRCLVISGADAWNAMANQKEKLILIANSALDLSGEPGTKLIQKARRSGHAVIFGGPAGGIPDPASAPLRAPRTHQLKDALEQAGSREDGTCDGDAFTVWLEAVKEKCFNTGHLEIAMTMLGHALIHVPPDPDGLWIHRSAAAALNAKDAGDIREGFRIELFNSRGVHGFSAGRDEKELAAKYQMQADAVEVAGFHRVATTLRELAASYKRDAERDSVREPFDD